MHISEDSLDDILMVLFDRFLNESYNVVDPSKGRNKEVFGVLLELKNPRARLSRSELKGTPYSCIGELSWYLSGSDKLSHMEYYLPLYKGYSDDGISIHGAYGPRLFNKDGKHNQVENIISLLTKKSSSRRAVIQLFDASDLTSEFKDIPCTTILQFVIRNNCLDMMVHMRSNDIYKGLPHDFFCFTMLQEIISNKLNVNLGTYKHSVGSLHLYNDDFEKAAKYINGGWQRQLSMPAMSSSNIIKDIDSFLHQEYLLRSGDSSLDLDESLSSSYWNDLLLLLKAFNVLKHTKNKDQLNIIQKKITNDLYCVYIEKLKEKLTKSL